MQSRRDEVAYEEGLSEEGEPDSGGYVPCHFERDVKYDGLGGQQLEKGGKAAKGGGGGWGGDPTERRPGFEGLNKAGKPSRGRGD